MKKVIDQSEKGHVHDAAPEAPLLEPSPQEQAAQPAETEEKAPRISQAKKLLTIVKERSATFFRNETGDAYAALKVASLTVGDHTEILPLEGRDFKNWLNSLYYAETNKTVGIEAINQVIGVLSGEVRFNCSESKTLYTRVAEKDGAFWYDLTNPAWQAIRVTADGWTVRDDPPILFNRYKHQTAQSMPQPGGDVRKLLKYVNIKGVDTLFLCWLITCFIPEIIHPMLILYGEKGAAKSTASSLLKALIDPSALGTMALQNDQRTLVINLQQHWFLPFDNVSRISEETSDTLCRAITREGIQQRMLYTNAEDIIFTFIRCLALNGINNVATRPDLLDRSLLIELERITETDRKELAEIKASFEADRSAILGGILDTLVKAMKIFPSVKLDKHSRMADFNRWGYAIGEALGGLGQEFLDQYAENREAQNIEAINSDPVAILVLVIMENREEWNGLVSTLLTELRRLGSQHGINTSSKSFPAQPNGLSRRLRAIKSNLEGAGILCEFEKKVRGIEVTLRRANLSASSAYLHKPSKINGLSDADNIDSSACSSAYLHVHDDDADKHADKNSASASRKALQINGYADDAGDADEFPTFRERTPFDDGDGTITSSALDKLLQTDDGDDDFTISTEPTPWED